MTTQLTSKLSLYDALGMMLPGCMWLWCGKIIFSNCSWSIVLQAKNIIDKWSCHYGEAWNVVVFLAAGYIVGLLAENVIGEFWRQFITNRPSWVTSVYKRKIAKEDYRNIQNAKGTTEQEKYYYAYEYVRQYSNRYSIDIVETQVAMLRNTRWPASILVGLLVGKAATCCCFGILAGLLIWFIMYGFALLRLQKVYEMVFDSYEFLIDVENSKK